MKATSAFAVVFIETICVSAMFWCFGADPNAFAHPAVAMTFIAIAFLAAIIVIGETV